MNKIVILTVDSNNEPVDLEKKVPVLHGRIVMNESIPSLGTPAFAAFLEGWHRKNNPQLFVDELREEG